MSLHNKTCEWCTNDITYNENLINGGLCDDCFGYTQKNTIRECDNYLNCGKHANITMGTGKLCDGCRLKLEKPLTEKEKKIHSIKFVTGLKKALSMS